MNCLNYGLPLFSILFLFFSLNNLSGETVLKTKIVDTGQVNCFNNSTKITYPRKNQSFYGQDAQYECNVPSYQDNNNGTITDLNTILMWSKAVGENKSSLFEAKKSASRMKLGGYSDWRVPSIKELYTLIDFRGYTGFARRGFSSSAPANAIPFINTDYFNFRYGSAANNERYIDAQWLSSTEYVSTTMNGSKNPFWCQFCRR